MVNDPKADLIYALLTLDSYNRGYGSPIDGLAVEYDRTKLGQYTIVADRSDPVAFNAGFYAIAYKKGDETVIAYRGTDVKGLSASATMGSSDVLNGYGLALS